MLAAIVVAAWLKQIPDPPTIVGVPLNTAGVVIVNLSFNTVAHEVCGAPRTLLARGIGRMNSSMHARSLLVFRFVS